MFNKKILSLLMLVGLMNVSLQARQQDADMVSYKDYVEKPNHKAKKEYKEKKEKKEIENKVKVSNNLPGHLQKGQIAKESFLKKGTMINTNKYENIKNTDLYRIKDKVYRISRKTREILDIFN